MTTPLDFSSATVHYAIIAESQPGALSRVMELFTLRGITPDLVKARKYQQNNFHDSTLDIDIHITGLSRAEQDIIRHKLESQISVQSVRQEILFRKGRRNLASRAGRAYIPSYVKQ